MSAMHSSILEGDTSQPRENPWSPRDVEAILRERGWLLSPDPLASGTTEWISQAAELLGPHANDRSELEALLSLCFCYDPAEILREPASHIVLAREGAREVIRTLALELLSDAAPLDSERYHALIESLKLKIPFRSRSLFHPIRLALAGRAGEGALDRVILLLDRGALARQLAPIKSNHARILEFCAALE
jgi:hypothetical protein